MRRQGPAKHAAIVSGTDRMIHAWSGHAVVETHIGRWWRARAAFAFRFSGIED
jgi:cell wall-associated NlpC family hydrolase